MPSPLSHRNPEPCSWGLDIPACAQGALHTLELDFLQVGATGHGNVSAVGFGYPMSKHISKNAIARCSSNEAIAHPLNPRARRRTLSLGDETGLSKCAVHLNIVAPGDETTEFHVHEFADEFVYILSGNATVLLDDAEHEVGAGDFIAFPARGPAHRMKNAGTTDLVYLVGGDRSDHDVCDYPRLDKRVYVSRVPGGRRLDFVDCKSVNSVRRP